MKHIVVRDCKQIKLGKMHSHKYLFYLEK